MEKCQLQIIYEIGILFVALITPKTDQSLSLHISILVHIIDYIQHQLL